MSTSEGKGSIGPTTIEIDEGGRQLATDQVENVLDAIEWIFRQASKDDREYLLSRGFRSVFRNDGAFRAVERRKISATAFNTMLPLLSVLNFGVREAPGLLQALGRKAPPSFEAAISAIVEVMKSSGAPAKEQIFDLAPFFVSFAESFSSSMRSSVGSRPQGAIPQRPISGSRSLEEKYYDSILPWLREHRSSLSEEAWVRVFLAAAKEIDEDKKSQRFLEKVLSAARKRS